MHLVSCRNVLIYLTSQAQKHVLRNLHFALEPGGQLFLSSSETTSPQRDLFATLSQPHSIYRKIGPSLPMAVARSRSRQSIEAPASVSVSVREGAKARGVPPRRARDAGDLARHAVLEAFAPPLLIVSEDGMVVFSHGDIEPYVRMPKGDNPRFELNAVLRPEIATRVRGALYKCRRDGERVTAESSPDAGHSRIKIEARPAPNLGAGTVVLAFEPVAQVQFQGEGEGEAAVAQAQPPPQRPAPETVVEHLEKELQATREDLRDTLEELETSNEELRSSSEESMSMNEELQSANEELEATTEELRSLNEELTTVNAQLREKIGQLEQAHDDLNNFFASTKIATIFLDDKHCIKKFTPAARELFGVDAVDVGRSIRGIARELLQNDLEQEARAVLEHLHSRSREIHTRDGKWIARQVLPYRTESRRIEGVVVTFVDVTELKAITEKLALREQQQSVIARLGLHVLREFDLYGFMEQVVREVQQTLGTDYCKILELQPGEKRLLLRAGVGWRPGLVGCAYVGTGPDSQAGYSLQSSEPVIVADLAREKRFSGPPLLIEHEIVSGLSCVIRNGERPYGVLGAHTRRHRVFGPEDAYFLQAVAGVVGSAIARHQTRTRLSLELGVAQVLAEATDLDKALSAVLEHMAEELCASVSEVWWADEGKTLRCRLRQVSGASDKSRVEEQFAKPCFEPGEGLVGRIYRDGAAAWCTDIGDPALFTRRKGAQALGLVSGVGLPVYARNGVVGVITLFSRKRLFADEFFLRSLDVIGRTLGDFIIRSEFEQRVRSLAAITASSHDAIISYRVDGTVTEWLSGAERLFGYCAEEMLGQSIERIVPEDKRQVLWANNERIVAGEVLQPFEATRICKNGQAVTVSVRSSAVKDYGGRIVGISSTDRDISRQKEAERNLIEADRQKDEFLAMLGHELRNPLAAIRSAAEHLKLTSADQPRLGRTQAILERQSAHMIKLLDGLLDVSRIIRGKIQLEPRVLDLAAVCGDVATDAAERPGGRELEIRTDAPLEPIWVEADPVRLTQIADNLISNAIKYTPDGGRITLSVAREATSAVLSVRDTGVGIEPELLPHIFDVFRQSKQNLDRSHGGLGIGLALVKSLVEMSGGTVDVRSEGRDKGAEFVVRLPITNKRPANAQSGSGKRVGPMSILLIEDNEDAAELLGRLLELTGHRVTLATRAQQGIELVLERKFDVVLCDIGLPDGMSGFDVASTLRADARTQNIALVALTGYGQPEDKARCQEAGFDAHLTKPVDVATVHRVLDDVRSVS